MFIMGAETLRYSDIVEVIDAAKGAGVEKVGHRHRRHASRRRRPGQQLTAAGFAGGSSNFEGRTTKDAGPS